MRGERWKLSVSVESKSRISALCVPLSKCVDSLPCSQLIFENDCWDSGGGWMLLSVTRHVLNRPFLSPKSSGKKSGFLLQSWSRRQMDAPIISARSGLYLQFLLLRVLLLPQLTVVKVLKKQHKGLSGWKMQRRHIKLSNHGLFSTKPNVSLQSGEIYTCTLILCDLSLNLNHIALSAISLLFYCGDLAFDVSLWLFWFDLLICLC